MWKDFNLVRVELCKAQFWAPHSNMLSTHEMYKARLSLGGIKCGEKIRGQRLPKAWHVFWILLLMSAKSVRSGVKIEPRYLNLVQKWMMEPLSKIKSSISSSELEWCQAWKCITSVFNRLFSMPMCIVRPKRQRWRFRRETPSRASWKVADRSALLSI